ncbi:MAG: metallophosphoesterase family protein [archaeon]
MTRIALLADLHANQLALNLALEAVYRESPDRIIVAGDLIGCGPDTEEVINTVRKLGLECTLGNHDLVAPEELEFAVPEDGLAAHRWSISQLSPESLNYLHALPIYARIRAEAAVCHGYVLPELLDYGPEEHDLGSHEAVKHSFGRKGRRSNLVKSSEYLREKGVSVSIGGHSHEGYANIFGPEGFRRGKSPRWFLGREKKELVIGPDEVACIVLPPVGLFQAESEASDRAPGFLIYSPEERLFEFHSVAGYSPEPVRAALARKAALAEIFPEERDFFNKSIELYLARL